jgi:peptidoglycan hydrolase-like protein with peptidoglycan-binding domain
MTTLLRRLSVVLLPLAMSVPLALSTPDVAHGTAAPAQECRRTLPSYPRLEVGDRRPAVRTLQCAINDLGLGAVEVDGYYGAQTKAALSKIVRNFEGDPPHPYRITSGFWTLLYGAQLPDHVLARGDDGHAVRVLQRALRAAGYDLAVDGDFGAQTAQVVASFQQDNGMAAPTGSVDEGTRFLLATGGYA